MRPFGIGKKNVSRMCIFFFSFFSSSFRQTYVSTFKYFLAVTAQWNFLHRFLSLISRNIFEFISRFKIFFEKLVLFRVRDLDYFCAQYSSIVLTFNYLWVATVQWNFLPSLLLQIPGNFIGFISKFKIFFKNLHFFVLKKLFLQSVLYKLLTIFEWLQQSNIF